MKYSDLIGPYVGFLSSLVPDWDKAQPLCWWNYYRRHTGSFPTCFLNVSTIRTVLIRVTADAPPLCKCPYRFAYLLSYLKSPRISANKYCISRQNISAQNISPWFILILDSEVKLKLATLQNIYLHYLKLLCVGLWGFGQPREYVIPWNVSFLLICSYKVEYFAWRKTFHASDPSVSRERLYVSQQISLFK